MNIPTAWRMRIARSGPNRFLAVSSRRSLFCRRDKIPGPGPELRMNGREFFVAAGSVVALPLAAYAQKQFTIGYLGNASNDNAPGIVPRRDRSVDFLDMDQQLATTGPPHGRDMAIFSGTSNRWNSWRKRRGPPFWTGISAARSALLRLRRLR